MKREQEVIIYLNEIIKSAFLTAEKERIVLKMAKDGDKKARDRLVKSHLPLVVNIAKHYLNHGLPLADLIQEGNIALVEAIDKFNLKWKNRFNTYATYCIRQRILRAIYNKGRIIRLPVYIYERIMKLRKAEEEYKKTHKGKSPNDKELAKMLNMKEEELRQLKNYFDKVNSLEEFNFTVASSSKSPEDIVVEEIFQEELKASIEKALNELDYRERKIIKDYFGLGKEKPTTLKELSETYNLTKERIRQIKNMALKKLAESPYLKNYLIAS